jgi:hypothetical protein
MTVSPSLSVELVDPPRDQIDRGGVGELGTNPGHLHLHLRRARAQTGGAAGPSISTIRQG